MVENTINRASTAFTIPVLKKKQEIKILPVSRLKLPEKYSVSQLSHFRMGHANSEYLQN